ncbi:LysR family transcriptional regulator [Streptomyces sp. NPDC059994]|uniref:helix-turn-helix domain-containing protein n=1 Tax=Streptomyces sp. NPDC059994 TaxID=3347029 RepID=UPI00369E91A8
MSSDLAPRELCVLAAVEQKRSFSGAAVALGMTQSAVSHSVRSSGTAPRPPGSGGPSRTGSRRPRCRPRTTEQCSRW